LFLSIHNLPALLAQAQGGSGLGSLVTVLPLAFIFVIFYFLLIRPQQKKQKEWNQMLTTIKNGDQVVTSGGMRGTVVSVKDDSFILQVAPDRLRVEIVKSGIVSLARE
jgi:preprotein translocase subunit YajC